MVVSFDKVDPDSFSLSIYSFIRVSGTELCNLPILMQMQMKKCSWLSSPPLVCAHGGDSTRAFPNTVCTFCHSLSQMLVSLGTCL